jgi:precorrin-6A/cobalt-precorrin-6A reductase
MRMLLLGGTAEARALAKALHAQVDVISSLAGRVPDPVLPVGSVRVGGVDGLRRWLREEHIDAVVDATHPFAARITAHAAEACSELGLPHLILARPAWDPGEATVVTSDAEAAEVVAQYRYSRMFLTTGRSRVNAFADSDAWFLIARSPRQTLARCRVVTNWCCPAGRIAMTTNTRCCASTASRRWSPRTAAAT